MAFTAKDVMTLREKSGAGMLECKKALTDADGDMEKAAELLRERGIVKAIKKEGRIAAEGAVAHISALRAVQACLSKSTARATLCRAATSSTR